MQKFLIIGAGILLLFIVLYGFASFYDINYNFFANGENDEKVLTENDDQAEENGEDQFVEYNDSIDDYIEDEPVTYETDDPSETSTKRLYSPFTGQNIREDPHIKAVMASIENTAPARPQSGLNSASLVYEFLVEGGITRFLALFRQNIPENIGPIRSLRSYMVKVADDYNSLVLHSGASPQGFNLLDKLDIESLDQIYNGRYYWRNDDYRNPHDLFTRPEIKSYVYNHSSKEYDPRFKFQPVRVIDVDKKVKEILIDYWGKYQVFYEYNDDNNNYKRYINDFEPHLTDNDQQIITDNIIVKFMPTRVIDEQGRLEMDLEGQGDILVFRNGTVIEGTWKKESGNWAQFYDDNGEQIRINPGKTWIQVVPRLTDVEYGESIR